MRCIAYSEEHGDMRLIASPKLLNTTQSKNMWAGGDGGDDGIFASPGQGVFEESLFLRVSPGQTPPPPPREHPHPAAERGPAEQARVGTAETQTGVTTQA